jgi:outer membrane protein OmpA-like peptidoglycan-associated protein
MTIRHLACLAVLALAAALALPPEGLAQDQLTRNQIVNSLLRTEATAMQFDPAAVQAEADRAAARGDTRGNATPLLTEALMRRLPQLSLQINFDRGSARIRPDSFHTVGLIADALHTPALMTSRFAIVGHTDSTGTRQYNLDLSKRRANAVMRALTTTFAVPARQLVAIGLGQESLLDRANPESGVNRRVQIINIGE